MTDTKIKAVKIGFANHPQDDSKAVVCVVCSKDDAGLYSMIIRECLASYEWNKKGNILTGNQTDAERKEND